MRDSKIFSQVDLFKGFHQIKNTEETALKCAFSNEFGQFEGELEIIVTGGFPVMNGRHTRCRVKGRVAFNGMKNLGVFF